MRFDCAMASGLRVGPHKIEPKPTKKHSKSISKKSISTNAKKCRFVSILGSILEPLEVILGALGGPLGVFGPSWVVFSAPWLKEPPSFN